MDYRFRRDLFYARTCILNLIIKIVIYDKGNDQMI